MFEDAIKKYLSTHGAHRIELRSAMFDMDGVLFDSMKNHAWSWHEAMKHYGYELSEEEVYTHEGRTGAGTINSISMRYRGHEATEDEKKEIYGYKSKLFNSRQPIQPMEGALSLLKQVKASGVSPLIVTGSGQRTLLEKVNSAYPGIFNPDLMVTAFDVKVGKPNPEPYLMGLEKAHVNASQSIVVENAPLGVRAGVAAGVFTIAVNTGPLPDKVLLDAGADLLFHSMQELSDSWAELYESFKNYWLFIN